MSYGTQIYTSPYPPNSQFGPRGVVRFYIINLNKFLFKSSYRIQAIQLCDNRMNFLMVDNHFIINNNNILDILRTIYMYKLCILVHILVNKFVFLSLIEINKKTFLLAYQVPSHYPSVSVPTPISNQTPSQYSTTNSQLTTQSSQPAQQSSVMIIN